MSSYNTGATGAASGISNTAACTLTLPAGVLTNDVMIATVMIFTYSGATAVVTAPTSGAGGANTWTPIGSPIICAQGSFECISACFYRVATSTDASSTFSVKYGGAVPSTNALYWAIEVESYTGFYTASPIGNYGSTNAINSTTLTVPSVITARNSSWGIQLCDAAVSSGGNLSAPAATNRHLNNTGTGINCAMSDTNGSAGAAGSSIGAGTFTAANGTAGGGMTWVIELCTQAAPSVTPGGTPLQIPHPLWFDLLEVAQSRADWQAQGVASPTSQSFRLMDGAQGRPGNGPGTATANSTPLTVGTKFYPTQGGTWFQGYWWWVCAAGSQPTTPQKFALWSVIAGTGAGSVVPGSVVTSGTLTAGQWNYIPLPQPVQLAINGVYTAATGISGPYPDTANQFGSGNPYSAGIISGPVTGFSDTGASNSSPDNTGTSPLNSSGGDPAITQPINGTGNHDNYWIDVQVTAQAPAGYQGSYRLWPNMTDADYVTSDDASVNYVIGTEIILAQPSVVNAIWYYIPSGQGSSNNQWATSADVWNVRTGVRVATQPNPVWLKPVTGGVDGNSNSGRWVYTQLPGTVTLQPGDYYVTIYNGNGSPNGWGAKTLGYWQASTQGRGSPDGSYKHSPAAPNGIASGPLYAPTTPAASDIQDYEQPATIEPGQSVFAVGPPNQFPNRYVGGSSGGGTGPNLYQNYWIDLEVTPASTWQPDTPEPPQFPHPLWPQLLEVAQARMLPDSGTEATPPGASTITGQGALSAAAGTGSGGGLGGQGTFGAPAVIQGTVETIAGGGALGPDDSTLLAPQAISGQGALSAASAVQVPATFAGQGALAATAIIGAPATITGQGALGPDDVTVQAPSVIAGQGALSPGDSTMQAPQTITGAGALGPDDSTIQAPMSVTGQGTLSAATAGGGAGTIGGQGTLAAPVVQGAVMTVAGQGALASAGGMAGAGTMGGQGALGLPVTIGSVIAVLAGQGSLTGTGGPPGNVQGTAAISGQGALGAVAAVVAIATITGQGNLTAAQLALAVLGYATAPGVAAAMATAAPGSTEGAATAGTWP